MRVMPSLQGTGFGLALLAMFGAGALAQQAQRLERPAPKIVATPTAEPTKVVVRPTRFTWSELVQLDRSIPHGGWVIEKEQNLLSEESEQLEAALPDPGRL